MTLYNQGYLSNENGDISFDGFSNLYSSKYQFLTEYYISGMGKYFKNHNRWITWGFKL